MLSSEAGWLYKIMQVVGNLDVHKKMVVDV